MTQEIIQKLNEGIQQEVFPNAELLIGKNGKILLHEYAGTFHEPEKAIFDLASLTKPLCTAILTAIFLQENKLRLEDPISYFFSTATLRDVTLKEILNHTSGIADWAPLYWEMLYQEKPNYPKNKQKILEMILNDDNLFRIPHKSVYSDLGYILLGAILEKTGKSELDQLFQQHISNKLNISDKIFFIPLDGKHKINPENFVPSERCALRKKIMQAQVMDRNCYVQGGISGHAGLFSNAETIHKLLSELRLASLGESKLLKKEIFDLFCRPNPHRNWEEISFTLGFETPTKGKSQSGTLYSKNSIGHLGYAGTSFWWDLEKDFWIILLTNRCMPNRKNFKIQHFRPEFHDLIVNQLNSLKNPAD